MLDAMLGTLCVIVILGWASDWFRKHKRAPVPNPKPSVPMPVVAPSAKAEPRRGFLSIPSQTPRTDCVIAGPSNIDGEIARMVELPSAAGPVGRIEVWRKGAGWVDAGKSVTADEFIFAKPVSPELAMRMGFPPMGAGFLPVPSKDER